ncbi:hypothetical protein BCR36DRAFT_404621 [Piromyces finnis]|uniref:Uncharacterized protein n=1 Tax=Piromyces finnis TaxID=1754191 RepID=A0A1Y1UW55_9FUNG|nr:hypothetical protein BCR36DRAFT_407135 [Piromyces finnis]ORX49561.1 hypothetical protein BCR36DRAFT_404621 [Piromyces finnis]|eukprot:ORX42238.1 hypothetical protein BCR36DRAFT_407135 [Piromyces finnis]
MNIYPYCVFDYVYNCNSSFPFLIIMLNTCKLFVLPNYRYEYVLNSDKNLFNFNDDFVQAIFSMYKKNSISIIDNATLTKYIKQYVSDNKTVLITEKEFSDEKNIKNITAYHYSIMNENNKKVIIYGVWNNEDYYPCKASIEILKSTILNKPYLLLKRNLDGSIYSSFKNNSIYMFF